MEMVNSLAFQIMAYIYIAFTDVGFLANGLQSQKKELLWRWSQEFLGW